jgi:excisionase family DNA binding protein
MRHYRRSTNARITPLRETSPGLTAGHGESVLPPLSHAVPFDPGNSLLGGTYGARDGAMSQLLTVGQVATLLNVPRKWVYRRVGLKPPEGIPHVKVGKYLRFRETDVRGYIERLLRN